VQFIIIRIFTDQFVRSYDMHTLFFYYFITFTTMNVICVKGGQIADGKVAETQLVALQSQLRWNVHALGKDAHDIVARVDPCEVGVRLLAAAQVELEAAEAAASKGGRGRSLRSADAAVGTELEGEMLDAEDRLSTAIVAYEQKADRLAVLLKSAAVQADQRQSEATQLVAEFAKAFPPPVLMAVARRSSASTLSTSNSGPTAAPADRRICPRPPLLAAASAASSSTWAAASRRTPTSTRVNGPRYRVHPYPRLTHSTAIGASGRPVVSQRLCHPQFGLLNANQVAKKSRKVSACPVCPKIV